MTAPPEWCRGGAILQYRTDPNQISDKRLEGAGPF